MIGSLMVSRIITKITDILRVEDDTSELYGKLIECLAGHNLLDIMIGWVDGGDPRSAIKLWRALGDNADADWFGTLFYKIAGLGEYDLALEFVVGNLKCTQHNSWDKVYVSAMRISLGQWKSMSKFTKIARAKISLFSGDGDLVDHAFESVRNAGLENAINLFTVISTAAFEEKIPMHRYLELVTDICDKGTLAIDAVRVALKVTGGNNNNFVLNILDALINTTKMELG